MSDCRNEEFGRCETCTHGRHMMGDVHPWGATTAQEPDYFECDFPTREDYGEGWDEEWGITKMCPFYAESVKQQCEKCGQQVYDFVVADEGEPTERTLCIGCYEDEMFGVGEDGGDGDSG